MDVDPPVVSVRSSGRRVFISGGQRYRRRSTSVAVPLVGVLFLLLCVGPAQPCGPGRGAGQRRGPRKMTPLVFKQHVPNVSENTLGASGPAEGRITRTDQRFKDLVTNNNPDIVFKDEEGTGADRIMSQRCRDKLNTLAVLVINQWPGVKLRVTETWTEQPGPAVSRPAAAGQSPSVAASQSDAARPGSAAMAAGGDSLHFEGRAVDITTSDRDRTKYGMLARLAVEAGFDWVYYESRSHIHCSVKSDSSIAASYGGCFPGYSTVRLESGHTTVMSNLSVGEKVLTFDPDTSSFRFDEVVAFVHRSPTAGRGTVYQNVETDDGHRLTLTPSHLIYYSDDDNVDLAQLQPKFAGQMSVGSYVFVSRTSFDNATAGPKPVRVAKVTAFATSSSAFDADGNDVGIYAPMTSSGTIVVDDVVSSCYAAFGNHRVAHAAMTPLVLGRRLAAFAERWLLPVPSLFPVCDDKTRAGGECTHWYAGILRTLSEALLPDHMWYNSDL